MNTKTAFEPEPFRPHFLARNPHVQTIMGSTTRRSPNVWYRRYRLDTPDGDFVDVDFAEVRGQTWISKPDDSPIVLLLHGLEGDARRGYAGVVYETFSAEGLRCVGLNFRSCSGELNRTPSLYHLGATGDVQLVHDWLTSLYPDAPVAMIGFSLGANVLLKYLGENGEALQDRVFAAAAISPPFDVTGPPRIERGINRFYGQYLLRKLKRKVHLNYDIINQGGDAEAAVNARTITGFDEAVTAPLHGYADAADYYAQNSSQNFLDGIRVPTVIVRAQDDPFFNMDIPFEQIDNQAMLTGIFPERGGHVGFIEGIFNRRDWAIDRALQFFQAQL